MTSVFIANACPIGTSPFYRATHLCEQLHALGLPAQVHDWTDEQRIDPNLALSHDIIVLYRLAMNATVRAMIDQARRLHKPVIFDTDDLIFEPHMTAWHRGAQLLAAAEKALYDQGVRRYQMTLQAADYVMTATPLLALLAQRHQKQAFVHRNALGESMLATANNLYAVRNQTPNGLHTGSIVVGYGSGTPTHDEDFQQVVPALLEILTRYPQVQLWLAGPLQLPPSLTVLSNRIQRFPLMEWPDWFKLAARFDINLAPLEPHNLFCRAKSEIKFVEAGALGIPTVATRIDAFQDAITSGDDGMLVDDEVAWISALDRLIVDASLRQQMGERARDTVMEHYSPSARRDNLRHILDAVLSGQHAPAVESVKRATTATQRPSIPVDAKALQSATSQEVQRFPENSKPLSHKHAQSETDSTSFVPLVLNWLVWEPFPGSGGHTNIFRMIKFLVEFGHECHVYIVPIETLLDKTSAQLRAYVDTTFMITNAQFHLWTGIVDDADATIATYWKSVSILERIPNAGQRYYFVQDFEPYFYPMGSEYVRAENTYRRGLHCITLGAWLAQLLRTRYQAVADHFDFAVETDIYFPRPIERDSKPRIAFYARPTTPRRAYEIGIEALTLLKAQQPNLEIVFFGAEKLPSSPPFAYTNMGILNPYELALLYANCDAGLVLSLTNPSLVPFEMMACRCPVVDIRTEQSEELLTHEETALLAEPTPDDIAATLMRLIRNQDLREKIADAGHRHVSRLSWRASARQLETILLNDAPVDERVFIRRQETDESSALLWQISELLQTESGDAEQINALRQALYQALAEKAMLHEQVRRIETQWAHTRLTSGHPDTLVRLPADLLSLAKRKANQYAPLALLGNSPLTGLPLTQEPLYQTFRADRSHFRRIELRFDAVGDLHIGLLQITLHTGDHQGAIVFQRSIPAATIYPNIALQLDFPPQTDSFQQSYTLVIQTSSDPSMHGFVIRRFLFTQHADAHLQRGAKPLAGQVAFQAFYGEAEPYILPPRRGPSDWDHEIRPTTDLLHEAASQAAGAGRETLRLAARILAVVSERGVRGLIAEAFSYLRWHLDSPNRPTD